jgi:tRNA(Leu) C34 or U34 (ribose-2'-O)-methylase TrmL
MGVKVAGIWELGWNTPLNESWLWTFPLREFAVMDWHMTPVTGIQHNERHTDMQLTEHHSTQEMVNSMPEDYVRVFIDEKGATPLKDFVHPENAVYFFGKAGESPIGYKREQDVSVYIPTIANNGVMWPHQVLVAILYDRLVKEQG